MALAGGCVGLYLLWRDALTMTGTNFWVPLLICTGVMIGGIYSISRPFRFEARFDPTNQQMTIISRGFTKTSECLYSYDDITGFSISESDNDGYWYTPMVDLKDSQRLELGFGYSAQEPAERFLEELITLIKTANP
jgi:hypothetical protein